MLAASYSLVMEGANFGPEHLSRLASITNISTLVHSNHCFQRCRLTPDPLYFADVLVQPIINTVIGFAAGTFPLIPL
jgi:hypothetical protein